MPPKKRTPKKARSQSAAAPSVVIKELQRFGAFMAGRTIFREKTKEEPVRFSEYRDFYHGKGGNDDTVSMVDQIIAEKGIFSYCQCSRISQMISKKGLSWPGSFF
jgi:hypothetical protein